MNNKTKWLFKMKYKNGIIRCGYNRRPDKDRPYDIVRLMMKSKDETTDTDISMTVGEALDVSSGLSFIVANRLFAAKMDRLDYRKDFDTGADAATG